MNDNDTSERDDRFDAAMRQRHAPATTRLSPRVRSQLQQRRIAAMRTGTTHASNRRWIGGSVAASCAAVLAIVVGMQIHQQPMAPAATPAVVADNVSLDTVLDENPDFYLWLASRDANTFAVE